jgi:hypothetical protein
MYNFIYKLKVNLKKIHDWAMEPDPEEWTEEQIALLANDFYVW